MPMMPFMGVRISWLMLARNSLLVWVAASAASLAAMRSRSSCLNSVTSWLTPYRSVGLPSALVATLPSAWIMTVRPSSGRL